MFDPFTATFEEARDAQFRMDASAAKAAGPTGPLYQWASASRVSASRERIEKEGDGFEVLACINRCVTHGLIAPEWLAYAYNRRFYEVLGCRVGSWDDAKAFGLPYPKGTHLAALRKARLNRVAVALAVREVLSREPDTAIDGELFRAVGKPLGLGKSLAAKLYYEALKFEPQPPSRTARGIQNFPQVQKKSRKRRT